MDHSAFRSSLQRASGGDQSPGHPNPGLKPSLNTCTGLSPRGLGVGVCRPQSRALDLGGLVVSLALCPYPGQKCAIAVLFLAITARALGNPCCFHPRVAPRARGIEPSFRPLEEQPPASELRTLSSSLPSAPCSPPLSSFTAWGPQFQWCISGHASQEPPGVCCDLLSPARAFAGP